MKFSRKVLSTIFCIAVFLLSSQVTSAGYVHGYYRSNGTYVNGYYRSNPDSNPYNNYGFPGNTNPYTGVTASGNVSTYLNNYYNKSSDLSGSSSYQNSSEFIDHGYKSYGIIMCDYGYYELSGSCAKTPDNGYMIGTSLRCKYGYYKQGNSCVQLPDHAYAIGSSLYCDYGYSMNSYGECVNKSQQNSYSSLDYYGSYIPTQTPTVSCPSHSTLEINNSSCSCDKGYETNSAGTKCLPISAKKNDKTCQNQYGKNSEWNKEYSEDGSPYCVCKSKYEWNASETKCIRK